MLTTDCQQFPIMFGRCTEAMEQKELSEKRVDLMLIFSVFLSTMRQQMTVNSRHFSHD